MAGQENATTLDGVADTLYIPLTAHIYVSKRFPDYFCDPKALELESAPPNAGILENSNEYQMIVAVARYDNLDEIVAAFASAHPACNIVNLGCGLETQYWRLADKLPEARFCDMDLPEVIEMRRRFLGQAPRETLVVGDLFDMKWADELDASAPTLFTVSGVFQHFHNEEVLGFIAAAKERFTCAELIFDATNSEGIKYTNRYVQKTGNTSAMMYCAIDDAELQMSCRIGTMDAPLRLKEYSTRGGISSYCLRAIMPSAMSSLTDAESTASDTLAISPRSSE